MFIAILTTFDDPDAAHLRYRNLSPTGVDVRIEEDQETDWERQHAFEKVSYLAVEFKDTPLQAIPAECFFVPTALDQEVVVESGKVAVVALKDPNERGAIYPVLVTLPKKGTLFQYQPDDEEGSPNVTISELETVVIDPLGRVLYQASDLLNVPESDDWFTYRLQDDLGHVSNIGTVSVKTDQFNDEIPPPVKTDTILNITQQQPFVIGLAVVFVTLSLLLIGFFGMFLYKRRKAREELEGFLSLAEFSTDAEGETTYVPKSPDGPAEEVENPVDLSDSLDEQ